MEYPAADRSRIHPLNFLRPLPLRLDLQLIRRHAGQHVRHFNRPGAVFKSKPSRRLASPTFRDCNSLNNRDNPDTVRPSRSNHQQGHVTAGHATLMVGESPPSTDMIFGWLFAGFGVSGDGD
jgi:hypothetical protein